MSSLRLLFTGLAAATGLLVYEARFVSPPRAAAAPAVPYVALSATGPTGDGSLAHPYRIKILRLRNCNGLGIDPLPPVRYSVSVGISTRHN